MHAIKKILNLGCCLLSLLGSVVYSQADHTDWTKDNKAAICLKSDAPTLNTTEVIQKDDLAVSSSDICLDLYGLAEDLLQEALVPSILTGITLGSWRLLVCCFNAEPHHQ